MTKKNLGPYKFRTFLWDCMMCMLTCGFWIFYVVVRESHNERY